MPKITVFAHPDLCPSGKVLEASEGTNLCKLLLKNNIDIEHACEMSCACTTCHIIVRDGFDDLNEASEDEEDLLDKAWGLEPNSRLSCQTIPESGNFTVELPKYTINQVSEDH